MLKMIILARQARTNAGKAQQKLRFLEGTYNSSAPHFRWTAPKIEVVSAGPHHGEHFDVRAHAMDPVRKTAFWSLFCNVKTIKFQDRLGTNIEKVEGKGVFYRAL